jgi:hypothetical protein
VAEEKLGYKLHGCGLTIPRDSASKTADRRRDSHEPCGVSPATRSS